MGEPQPPAPCSHPHEDLVVSAIAEQRANGAPMAQIQLKCGRCQTPFRFLGFAQGMSFRKAMTDHTGTKLHCPIAPGEVETPEEVQTFEFSPDEAKAIQARSEEWGEQ